MLTIGIIGAGRIGKVHAQSITYNVPTAKVLGITDVYKEGLQELADKYGIEKVYEDYKSATGDETRTIIASTASPYKFSASVLEAIDGKKPEIDEFAMVDRLYEISQYEIPDALASLKDKEIRFSESVESNQMKDFVLKTLGM